MPGNLAATYGRCGIIGHGRGGWVAMREIDVAVIGAGPSGLFAAYYAGFRGLSVTVIDALPEPGGQVTAMYPEKLIHDIAGIPAIKGRDLVANLVTQAAPFDPEYRLGVRAEKLSHVDGRVVLGLSGGEQLACGAVIITGGLGSFSPRPLPAAENFSGTGIVYFVPRLADLAGKDVLIVGGGDSAFDWAAALQPLARSVTLVHRRDQFRGHAATVKQVMEHAERGACEVRVFTEVGEIHGKESIEAVTLVTWFDEDTPLSLILALRPDVLVKGGDYGVDQVVGAELVKAWGGEVKVLGLVENSSTTAIVEKIRSKD